MPTDREVPAVLSVTCRACDETMTAETEDELVDLGMAHAAKHGHQPPRAHVRARIRRSNPDASRSGPS